MKRHTAAVAVTVALGSTGLVGTSGASAATAGANPLQVAYQLGRGAAVHVVDADGTNDRVIATNRYLLAFDPDGSTVAVSPPTSSSGSGVLTLLAADGSGTTSSYPTGLCELQTAAWPTPGRIVLQGHVTAKGSNACVGGTKTVELSLPSGKVSSAPKGVSTDPPATSPDGSQRADVVDDGTIRISSRAGGGVLRTYGAPLPNGQLLEGSVTWSPDGGSLLVDDYAYFRDDEGSPSDYVPGDEVLSVPTGARRALPFVSGATPADTQNSVSAGNAFSPDGTTICAGTDYLDDSFQPLGWAIACQAASGPVRVASAVSRGTAGDLEGVYVGGGGAQPSFAAAGTPAGCTSSPAGAQSVAVRATPPADGTGTVVFRYAAGTVAPTSPTAGAGGAVSLTGGATLTGLPRNQTVTVRAFGRSWNGAWTAGCTVVAHTGSQRATRTSMSFQRSSGLGGTITARVTDLSGHPVAHRRVMIESQQLIYGNRPGKLVHLGTAVTDSTGRAKLRKSLGGGVNLVATTSGDPTWAGSTSAPDYVQAARLLTAAVTHSTARSVTVSVTLKGGGHWDYLRVDGPGLAALPRMKDSEHGILVITRPKHGTATYVVSVNTLDGPVAGTVTVKPPDTRFPTVKVMVSA